MEGENYWGVGKVYRRWWGETQIIIESSWWWDLVTQKGTNPKIRGTGKCQKLDKRLKRPKRAAVIVNIKKLSTRRVNILNASSLQLTINEVQTTRKITPLTLIRERLFNSKKLEDQRSHRQGRQLLHNLIWKSRKIKVAP